MAAICLKGLPRRTISPNEYQKSDQSSAIRLYYEQLSKLLHSEIQDEKNTNFRNDFVVQTLFVKPNNNDNQPTANNDKDNTAPEKLSKCIKQNSLNISDKSPKIKICEPTVLHTSNVSKAKSEKSVQTNYTVFSSKTQNISEINPSDYTETTDDNYSCVDLRSMAKLRKLCFMLRSNVIELKNVYKTRIQLGYTYTELDKSDLELGLKCLEDDVMQLMDTLDDANGYRVEIQKIVNKYNDLESQYRDLRSLNKKGRLSSNYSEMCTKNKNEGFDLCVIINKYICQPCYRLFKKVNNNEYNNTNCKS